MLLSEFMKDDMSISRGGIKIPIGGMLKKYKDRYEEMKKDHSKPFRFQVYTVHPGNRLIVHVKVPSMSLSAFYYDVLFELEPLPNAVSIEDCHVKIFSNSPSFVYSYAYVFYHLDMEPEDKKATKKKNVAGLLIDKLYRKIPATRLLMPGTEKKIGDEVLQNPPEMRNPHGLPMFDTSIYTAIYYLEDVTNIMNITSSHNNITENQLLATIPDFDKLMAQRKHEADIEGRANAKHKRINKEIVQTVEKNVRQANRIGSVKHTMKPKSPTAISSSRKPKTIGGKK